MLVYSRNYLFSLKSWWKCAVPGIQTSRHVQQQWTRPVPKSVWKTLKAAGLAKPTRGKRAGRFATNCHRIKPIHSVFRGDISQPISAIRLSEANRSLGHNHNTVTNSNNIIVHREPLEPPPSTSKPMGYGVYPPFVGVCSDEGLTLETSAKHHIPQATNIPYQPC